MQERRKGDAGLKGLAGKEAARLCSDTLAQKDSSFTLKVKSSRLDPTFLVEKSLRTSPNKS